MRGAIDYEDCIPIREGYLINDMPDTMTAVLRLARRISDDKRTSYVLEIADSLLQQVTYAANHPNLTLSLLLDYGSWLERESGEAGVAGELLECGEIYNRELQWSGIGHGPSQGLQYHYVDVRGLTSLVFEVRRK